MYKVGALFMSTCRFIGLLFTKLNSFLDIIVGLVIDTKVVSFFYHRIDVVVTSGKLCPDGSCESRKKRQNAGNLHCNRYSNCVKKKRKKNISENDICERIVGKEGRAEKESCMVFGDVPYYDGANLSKT
jgi:hypothetical protein